MTDITTLSRRVSEAEGPSILRRVFLCPLGLCQTFKHQAAEAGVWGECVKCGKRVGFISRAELRRYGEREEAKASAALLAIHERNKTDE